MPSVYLGLGSNIEPVANLQLAVRDLRNQFGDVRVSSVYRNAAVGFDGDDFLNCVVHVETELGPEELCGIANDIHAHSGRVRNSDRYSARTLDIDLLLYGDLVCDQPPVRVPRDDILNYSFVLVPLVEMAADLRHPQTGHTMAEHLQQMDLSKHPLEKLEMAL